jgi:hypothetical protein
MRIELRHDLNARMAKRVRPVVDRLAEKVAAEARPLAPPARVWVNVDDERVRPAHARADGQTIPANLRFKLHKQVYVHGAGRGHRGPGHTKLVEGEFVLAREPRDEDLPDDQKKNCRCADVAVPKMIAEKVERSRATVQGTRASAQVWVRFNRIVESFHGTSADTPDRWMAIAVERVAARTLR